MLAQGLDLQVARLYKLDGEGKTKAFVDIILGGCFTVKGLRVIEGKNGLFIGMPRSQSKDGRWYNTAYPLNKQLKEELTEVVLEAYNQ